MPLCAIFHCLNFVVLKIHIRQACNKAISRIILPLHRAKAELEKWVARKV